VNTRYEKMLIYTSVGYFTYDFLCMAWYGLLDVTMIIHHTVVAMGMSLALVQGRNASLVVGGMFIAEVSNPPMHVRVMLRHLGLRYSKAYEWCEIWFIMLYTFGRIIVGLYQVHQVCSCESALFLVKFAAVALLAQSIYFTLTMIRMLKNRFDEISNRKIHQIKIRWFEPLNKLELEQLGIAANKKEKTVSL
jgi:hypothetical protein